MLASTALVSLRPLSLMFSGLIISANNKVICSGGFYRDSALSYKYMYAHVYVRMDIIPDRSRNSIHDGNYGETQQANACLGMNTLHAVPVHICNLLEGAFPLIS